MLSIALLIINKFLDLYEFIWPIEKPSCYISRCDSIKYHVCYIITKQCHFQTTEYTVRKGGLSWLTIVPQFIQQTMGHIILLKVSPLSVDIQRVLNNKLYNSMQYRSVVYILVKYSYEYLAQHSIWKFDWT